MTTSNPHADINRIGLFTLQYKAGIGRVKVNIQKNSRSCVHTESSFMESLFCFSSMQGRIREFIMGGGGQVGYGVTIKVKGGSRILG